MMEIRPESEYVTHHIQKICAFFLSMRNFADELRVAGHQLRYFKINDADNQHSFAGNLARLIDAYPIKELIYFEPDEYRLQLLLASFPDLFPDLQVAVEPTYHFICSKDELIASFAGRKPLMESFYRRKRRELGILMHDDQALGGKWNFDKENRRSFPSDWVPPERNFPQNNVSKLLLEIEQAELPSLGKVHAETINWPVNRKQALACLDEFVDNHLHNFGAYQDAMHTESTFGSHSLLAFALNVKLLHPIEVIRKAESTYLNQPERYSLASVEGFIRQILGWREFVRGIYWANMPGYQKLNFFASSRALPKWYWTGSTKMNCLKFTINQTLNTAYAHHIQRLMITGNFALLAGCDPNEVDRWYLGVYIDAIEWAEMPNTRGMSQFADGGICGTKPYCSSSRYIKKMSNYCDTCIYNHREALLEDACPFNAMYWYFHALNREKLENNHRLSMVYRTWERFSPEKRVALIKKGENLLSNLDIL